MMAELPLALAMPVTDEQEDNRRECNLMRSLTQQKASLALATRSLAN